LNNITISILLVNFVLIFALPRRFVLIPILASGIILPMSSRIYIMGLDFTAIRFLLLFGWIRLIIKVEFHSMKKLNNIDLVLCLYMFSAITTYTLLWQTMDAFINRLGNAYYILGTYFLIRFYIRDSNDIERIIKTLSYIVIAIAFFVVIESITYHNYFSVFGSLPELMIRDGKLRCSGPFSHPITLGVFGAFLFPLAFYMLRKEKGSKIFGLTSLISSVIIVLASHSSGPLFALLASAIGLLMWHLRKHMRIIVWGIFLSILGLHLIMKAPVWALIQRVPFLSGSSNYHRFLLIDNAISRFNEWWLLGEQDTAHWNAYIQTWDVSNHYIRVGVDGGIVTLTLFILIIVLCFRHIGKMRILANDQIDKQKMFWSLGTAMFAYVVAFIDVSLWDKTIMIWYTAIAMISSITYNNGELPKEGNSAKNDISAVI
jgi:hypothetical protein